MSVGRRTSLLWAGLGWGTFACAGFLCHRSVNPALRPPTPIDSGVLGLTTKEAFMNDNPYTLDRWATPDDPEHGVVRFSDLRKMERACQGIWAISRIVGNSVNNSEDARTPPLDPWVVSNLLGGIESLCDHIADLVESVSDKPLEDSRFAANPRPIH